jgi:hypothetical protein
MKKKIKSLRTTMSKIALFLCASVMALSVDSCDGDEIMPTPVSLKNTAWEEVKDISGVTTSRTITFSDTTAVMTLKANGVSIGDAFTYVYEYEKPLLTLTATFAGGINLSGAVDGSKMTIRNTHAEETYVLTKKN